MNSPDYFEEIEVGGFWSHPDSSLNEVSEEPGSRHRFTVADRRQIAQPIWIHWDSCSTDQFLPIRCQSLFTATGLSLDPRTPSTNLDALLYKTNGSN